MHLPFRTTRGWLWLGLLALIGSGLFAVLLVLSRTPVLQDIFTIADFVRVALVVHVDLSVLTWFVSLAGLMWSINCLKRALALGKAALYLSAAGAVSMAPSPAAIFNRGQAIMANYIPVLDGPLFLGGFLLFAFGSCVWIMRSLLLAPTLGLAFDGGNVLRFGRDAGLDWSGGYGVQRKVAGSEQVLGSSGEIAGMGLMGLGAMIAVIGGLLFVVMVIRAMRGVPVDAEGGRTG